MTYAGGNQPVAPIDDPYQMFGKLYGRMKDRESLVSVLDDVQEDIKRVASKLSARDKALLDQHVTIVQGLEKDLRNPANDATLAASRAGPRSERSSWSTTTRRRSAACRSSCWSMRWPTT